MNKMPIFKAYDIRGIYPSELNEDIAYKIGRAIADFLNVNKIVIGRDMRKSSDKLFDAISKGICMQGTDVIDIGLCSTPMSYFACAYLKAGGSIMITASHNPPEYNGFKLTREQAIPIGGATGIPEIKELCQKNMFKEAQKKGKVIKNDITDAYSKHALSFVKGIKPLKVVVDAANAMGSLEAKNVLSKLPCEIIPLYFELDGSFPNHEANPLEPENLTELISKVKKEKADLGIAFDGDADRVFFVTEKGEIVPSDITIALISEDILSKQKGELILYDIRSSWITKEVIEANGGKALMCRVGHAFIKEQMRKTNAVFAGELAGHYYFRENFFADSGIIAALKMLEMISIGGKKLSELVSPLKKYFASGEINLKVNDKEAKMKELAEIYKDGKISYLDGIRVDYSSWWFNVRPSNTEPLLRLNLEAKKKEIMEKKRDEILKVIRN